MEVVSGCPWEVKLGCSRDVRLGPYQDDRFRHQLDGQIGSLGDVGGRSPWDVLRNNICRLGCYLTENNKLILKRDYKNCH